MTTGVAFFKWTDQGAHNYRETVDRTELNIKLGQKFHVQVREVLYTPGGPYDLIGIAEGPDLKALTAYCLELQSLGYVHIDFTEAYGPEEMKELVHTGG